MFIAVISTAALGYASGFCRIKPQSSHVINMKLPAVPLATPQASNEVCSEPAAKCDHKQKHFDEWELGFKMPAKLAPNKPYKSTPFYAVLLKAFEIDDDCDGGDYVIAIEKERKTVQKSELGRNVFASYQCSNMGAVDYDFAGKYDAKGENVLIGNFLAIYARTTSADAEKLLGSVKSNYPAATVKRMNATFQVVDH